MNFSWITEDTLVYIVSLVGIYLACSILIVLLYAMNSDKSKKFWDRPRWQILLLLNGLPGKYFLYGDILFLAWLGRIKQRLINCTKAHFQIVTL